MGKFSGSEGIYKELVEDVPEDEEWLLGLVAFAVVEEQKIEWIRHQAEHNGGVPPDEEISQWYQKLPAGVLLRAKDTAEARLRNYGENAILTYMDDYEMEFRDGVLLNEIRGVKKFWPQFGVNVAGGFFSTFLFAFILAIVAFIVLHDVSPVEVGKALRDKAEVIKNG
ncbi:hypothetical protein A3Q32_20970 [Alcanivorax sp. KX64203]|nr:hypothetical protein A3Q32_20970 [Alcanivorax sp. KX64203]